MEHKKPGRPRKYPNEPMMKPIIIRLPYFLRDEYEKIRKQNRRGSLAEMVRIALEDHLRCLGRSRTNGAAEAGRTGRQRPVRNHKEEADVTEESKPSAATTTASR